MLIAKIKKKCGGNSKAITKNKGKKSSKKTTEKLEKWKDNGKTTDNGNSKRIVITVSSSRRGPKRGKTMKKSKVAPKKKSRSNRHKSTRLKTKSRK